MNERIKATIFSLKGGIQDLFLTLGFLPADDKYIYVGNDMTTLKNGQALIKIAQETPCIHYWVLELERNATIEEIRKAFHKKSKILHPYKATGNTELFQ